MYTCREYTEMWGVQNKLWNNSKVVGKSLFSLNTTPKQFPLVCAHPIETSYVLSPYFRPMGPVDVVTAGISVGFFYNIGT